MDLISGKSSFGRNVSNQCGDSGMNISKILEANVIPTNITAMNRHSKNMPKILVRRIPMDTYTLLRQRRAGRKLGSEISLTYMMDTVDRPAPIPHIIRAR